MFTEPNINSLIFHWHSLIYYYWLTGSDKDKIDIRTVRFKPIIQGLTHNNRVIIIHVDRPLYIDRHNKLLWIKDNNSNAIF
jgi:hypothetical protein